MEQLQFKSLLSQVSTLNVHYKKINSLTGENFNIFRILKLESSEVRLHSAFLAALLNPKGSHGQKDTFLKLFIKHFSFKQNAMDAANCNVEIEKHTGFISEDGKEGGRIDIIIRDTKSGHQIIIENKIYAGDQHNQLTRYYNHSPNADLIYLTLTGKDPDKGSCGSLENDVHFKCYSYKVDILNWLEECRKEVAVFPLVRESITQYINLIKHLTNQTLNHAMGTELSQIIKSNLEASFTIADSLDNACDEVYDEFFIQLKEVCSAIGFNCTNNVDLDKNHTGIWISKSEWKYLNIGFQFQNYDKKLIYGFVTKKNPDQNITPTELRNKLTALSNNLSKTNKWWPWSQNMEAPYDDWSKYVAWRAMTDGSMLESMKDKIKLLNDTVQSLDL